ncbi:hypothetical protein BDA96_09G194200 [Sorghum bicolor]|uniref:Uncharacterized protein n=2 Tax=Sorghum bicolor TaxID=4558 RepID=A0A1B6P9C1_SORBI|nr:hypothetical protein BDA96_09G194200 [Sorghum bicolor]KXG22263.1 hypothetical protein SORBI_3009G183600 [Sorghum bicolor]
MASGPICTASASLALGTRLARLTGRQPRLFATSHRTAAISVSARALPTVSDLLLPRHQRRHAWEPEDPLQLASGESEPGRRGIVRLSTAGGEPCTSNDGDPSLGLVTLSINTFVAPCGICFKKSEFSNKLEYV